MNTADFVLQVIALYRRLAGNHVRPRRTDRELAAAWHHRGMTLASIEGAMLLALARRTVRPPEAPLLPPIRSLHYFIPLLEEVTARPLADHYLAYLRAQLAGVLADPDPGARPGNDVSR